MTKKTTNKKVKNDKAKNDSETCKIMLKQVLDISKAEDFKQEILEILDTKIFKKLIFDASSVARITTPCLQLILALKKTLNADDIKFEIENKSDAYKKAVADLGFEKVNL